MEAWNIPEIFRAGQELLKLPFYNILVHSIMRMLWEQAITLSTTYCTAEDPSTHTQDPCDGDDDNDK